VGLEPKTDHEILLLLNLRMGTLENKMDHLIAQQRIRVPRAVWAALAAALMGIAGWCGRGMVSEQDPAPATTERSGAR